jgi:lysine-specific demethylase 8
MLAPIAIERILPPTANEFYRLYVRPGKPVVITGMVNHWPALKLWSHAYFAEKFGQVEVTAQQLHQGSIVADDKEGVKQKTIALQNGVQPLAYNHWLITTPVQSFPEALKQDYEPPLYCAGGKFLSSRIFLSPQQAVVSLHQDLPENLYVLVKGKRQITLFAPWAPVYPNSRFSRLPNYAQVDINKPDHLRFPKFKKAQPYVVELQAGETLFIPSFWWHHLHSLEPSIGINFWWSQGWKVPIAWAGTTYAKLRGLGNYSSKKPTA